MPDGDAERGFSVLTDKHGEIVAASIKGRTWVWNLGDSTNERTELQVGSRNSALSGDGRYVVTADDDGMTVSNTATGALVQRFRAALGGGAGFSVSPDGRWIPPASARVCSSSGAGCAPIRTS